MITARQGINNLINFAREKTEQFVYSYFFPTIVALIVLLFWVANLQMVGFAIVTLIACLVLIVYDDFLPLVSFVFIIPMCFINTRELFSTSLVPTIIIFAFLLCSIVFHFIKYPTKITLDKYFYMLICVAIVFVIGGLYTLKFDNYFAVIDLFAISAVMPIAIHVFFYNKTKLNDKIDYRKYFCFCVICAVTLASLQLCYAHLYVKINGHWFFGKFPGGFSWANTNHIASIILIAVPLCCYMMTSSKYIIAWFVELLFLYVTVYLSGSDGTFATLLIFSPFLMYVLYQNTYRYNRKILINFYCFMISCVVLVLAYLCLFKSEIFLDYILVSSSGNGRKPLYTLALENFLSQPIFGLGFGQGRYDLDNKLSIVHNGFYHSTLFHLLSCAGIIGVIVYIIYYVVRIKYLTKGDTILGKYALFAFFMFACYGMVDNTEFNIVLMFMTTIITVVGLMNKKGSDDKPLPLYIKTPKF